jgi:hypothetical protein
LIAPLTVSWIFGFAEVLALTISPFLALITKVLLDSLLRLSRSFFALKTIAPCAAESIFDQIAREACPLSLISSQPIAMASFAVMFVFLEARASALSALILVSFVATAIVLNPLSVVLFAPQMKDCILSPSTRPLFVAIRKAPAEVFELSVLPIIEALFWRVFLASPPMSSEVGAVTKVLPDAFHLTMDLISSPFLSRKNTALRSEKRSCSLGLICRVC